MNLFPRKTRHTPGSPFFCIFTLTILFLAISNVMAQRIVTKPDDPKCLSPSAIMEAETNEYIKANKIGLKSNDSKFYSNKTEQVFLLSSQEPVDLRRKKPIENVSAVINAKGKSGKSIFYTIEQKITEKLITYSVKRDSRVLQTINVEFKPGNPDLGGPVIPKKCQDFQNDFDAAVIAMQIAANQTCQTRLNCMPLCIPPTNPNAVAFVMFFVQPTSWKCHIHESTLSLSYINADLFVVNDGGGLVPNAIDAAIRNQSALFSPIDFSRK